MTIETKLKIGDKLKGLIPHDAAYWTGLIVLWLLVILVVLAALFFLTAIIWGSFLKLIWRNDWFAYHIRRKKIATNDLRIGYRNMQMNAYWKQYTFMYRLRNIKSKTKK